MPTDLQKYTAPPPVQRPPTRAYLSERSRRVAADRLADLCRRRHAAIPLKIIAEILQDAGVRWAEDFLLCGQEGRASLDLVSLGVAGPAGLPVVNSVLVLYWLKGLHDGQYEVNAYLS